jgi:hypothetical protein
LILPGEFNGDNVIVTGVTVAQETLHKMQNTTSKYMGVTAWNSGLNKVLQANT